MGSNYLQCKGTQNIGSKVLQILEILPNAQVLIMIIKNTIKTITNRKNLPSEVMLSQDCC